VEIVIYTQRVEVVENYQERRDCADQRIADFITACGFLPIALPNREGLAECMIEKLKPVGILLTGGNSLVSKGGNAPERDAMDHILIRLSIQYNIPLYGFCRGMQSILHYFGNQLEEVEGHVAVRHIIDRKKKSYEVNSYHTQACRKLECNSGLYCEAHTIDGVIEAVRHKEFSIIGTMWHPERERSFREEDIKMVKDLFSTNI